MKKYWGFIVGFLVGIAIAHIGIFGIVFSSGFSLGSEIKEKHIASGGELSHRWFRDTELVDMIEKRQGDLIIWQNEFPNNKDIEKEFDQRIEELNFMIKVIARGKSYDWDKE